MEYLSGLARGHSCQAQGRGRLENGENSSKKNWQPLSAIVSYGNSHGNTSSHLASPDMKTSAPSGLGALKSALTLSLLLAWFAPGARGVVTVNPPELAQKDEWVRSNLLAVEKNPPFSFTYGSRSSSTLLPSCSRREVDSTLDGNCVQHVLTWTDHSSGLQVKCVAIDYADYPVVEWTVYFQNTSADATAILENIQGLDIHFARAPGSGICSPWKSRGLLCPGEL